MNALCIEVSYMYDRPREIWEASMLRSGWKQEKRIFRKIIGEFVLFSLYKDKMKVVKLGCARLMTEAKTPLQVFELSPFKVEHAWPVMFRKSSQPESVVIKTKTDYSGSVLTPSWKKVSSTTYYNEALQVYLLKHGEYVPPYAASDIQRAQYFEFADDSPGYSNAYLERLHGIGFPILI